MTEQSARPLREVIGEGARRVREAVGVRQDDVSRTARAYGLAWDRARIGALERGEKAISAEELALLPILLTKACGQTVTLPELIDPDEEIGLSDKVTATGRALLDVYAGRGTDDIDDLRVHLFDEANWAPGVVAALESVVAFSRRLNELALIPDGATHGTVREFVALEREIGEPERKAAGKLGEKPLIVVVLSHALWGRTLAEERDRRVVETAGDASPNRLRALRGRVTRELVDQLREEIARRSGAAVGER